MGACNLSQALNTSIYVMIRSFWIAVLSFAVLAAPFASAQDLQPAQVFTLASKQAGLERRARFTSAWAQADSNARARARRVLRLERDGAVRMAATPSVRALTKAWRALVDENGGPSSKPNVLRDLADSLDLRISPGIYEGQLEGRPEPLTVHVASLYEVKVDTAVHLSLFWVGTDGVEIHARTEPIAAEAFAGVGFPMYVRAPSPVPGLWELVCQVSLGEDAARGIPVPMLGLDQLDAMSESVEASTRQEFVLLRKHGLRPLYYQRFLHAIGVSPVANWQGAQRSSLEHEAVRALEQSGVDILSLGAEGLDSPKRILLLLRPEDEGPEAIFVGAVGKAWLRAAEQHSWWVISTDLKLRADKGPSLLAFAEQLKRWKPASELVLVGRGSALLELQLAQLHRPDWTFDKMVLSTVLASDARPRNLPDLPGLVVSSDAVQRGVEDLEREGQASWRWSKRTEPTVITDLELPALIAAWLADA